jgi:hypothetical protein
MPIKTEFTTEQRIRQAALPAHGKSYAVIPHGYVIDETKRELAAAGFTISNELYKTNLNGEVAQGVYHLNYGNDQDMGLMFAWSNSYNKMMRFKCAVGAQVFVCMNGMVSGDIGNYARKHTGTALSDATQTIQYQISKAKEHYDNLVADKETFKQIILTKKEQASIIGQLYADQEILTLSQVGIVKHELDSPSHAYNAPIDSAWSLYNHITLALKDSHPMRYLSDHQKVHTFFLSNLSSQTALPAVEEDIVEEVIEEQEEFSYFEEAERPIFGVTFL